MHGQLSILSEHRTLTTNLDHACRALGMANLADAAHLEHRIEYRLGVSKVRTAARQGLQSGPRCSSRKSKPGAKNGCAFVRNASVSCISQ